MNGLTESRFQSTLQDAQRGDPKAIGELLIAHRNYLQLVARLQMGHNGHLRGKVEPSDVVQETIIEAQQNLAQFRGLTPNEFMAWLRKILATQLAQQVRRYKTLKRDPRLERTIHHELEQSSRALETRLISPGATPSEYAVRGEEATQVADALEQLPADHREVIILRNLEQRPFDEVAIRMRRSVDATKQLWVRAIKGLRNSIKQKHQ
jgi:RNA polymerase sigma-70 factor (ECF subfamily)